MAASVLSTVETLQKCLLERIPFVFNLPLMDIVGVPRLCVIMDQLFRETNRVRRPGEMYDDDSETDEKADGTKKAAGTRPSFIAEIFTILTLIFAGETILPLIHPVPASSHASHSIPPSAWLTNPTPLVMFTIVHYLVSRTGLNKFVPTKMSALWETALAGFDALGRSIVVCTFFVDAFLQKPYIASNWYTVIILTWIGVYGGGLVVNALDMFSSEWKFQTPGEFKPWGWTTVDFWVPPVSSLLYLTLLQPPLLPPVFDSLSSLSLSPLSTKHIAPWSPYSPSEARAVCGLFLMVVFQIRAYWNFEGQLRVRRVVKEARKRGEKIKTM